MKKVLMMSELKGCCSRVVETWSPHFVLMVHLFFLFLDLGLVICWDLCGLCWPWLYPNFVSFNVVCESWLDSCLLFVVCLVGFGRLLFLPSFWVLVFVVCLWLIKDIGKS